MWLILCIISMFLLIVIICGHTLENECKDIDKVKVIQKNKENLKQIEKLIWRLDGFQFEEFCSMLFSLKGIKNDLTSKTGDGGKDIILRTDEGKIYVECKHYSPKNLVSNPLIMKLIGSCTVDNINKAIFITTSGYSKEAINTIDNCKSIKIDRFYMNDLLEMCKLNTGYVLNWLYQRV